MFRPFWKGFPYFSPPPFKVTKPAGWTSQEARKDIPPFRSPAFYTTASKLGLVTTKTVVSPGENQGVMNYDTQKTPNKISTFVKGENTSNLHLHQLWFPPPPKKWVFPKIGGKPPNLIEMDDLGGPTLFLETPKNVFFLQKQVWCLEIEFTRIIQFFTKLRYKPPSMNSQRIN